MIVCLFVVFFVYVCIYFFFVVSIIFVYGLYEFFRNGGVNEVFIIIYIGFMNFEFFKLCLFVLLLLVFLISLFC